jgi:hypothetical protein
MEQDYPGTCIRVHPYRSVQAANDLQPSAIMSGLILTVSHSWLTFWFLSPHAKSFLFADIFCTGPAATQTNLLNMTFNPLNQTDQALHESSHSAGRKMSEPTINRIDTLSAERPSDIENSLREETHNDRILSLEKYLRMARTTGMYSITIETSDNPTE